MLKKILAEPLLHFVLLALLFFVIHGLVGTNNDEEQYKITLSSLRVEQLENGFEKTWSRAPNSQELKKLIDDYVLDEIYAREAQLIGLVENDTVVRKRLRQKMEFMLQDVSSLQEPDQKTLMLYYHANKDRYIDEARYSFRQVYISPQKNKVQVQHMASKILTELEQGNIPQGDSSLLAKQIINNTAFQVDRQFGKDFSAKLNTLALNQWSTTIRSGLGYHIVKLSERTLKQAKAFESIQAQLIVDWKYQQSKLFQQAYEQELLGKYDINIVDAGVQLAVSKKVKS